MLVEAGYGYGLEINITTSSAHPYIVETAVVIQELLMGVGVDVKIEMLEWGAYIDAWVNRDYQSMVGLNGAGTTPERALYFFFHLLHLTWLGTVLVAFAGLGDFIYLGFDLPPSFYLARAIFLGLIFLMFSVVLQWLTSGVGKREVFCRGYSLLRLQEHPLSYFWVFGTTVFPFLINPGKF